MPVWWLCALSRARRFVVDAVASIPWSYFEANSDGGLGSLSLVRLLKLGKLLRMARIGRIWNNLRIGSSLSEGALFFIFDPAWYPVLYSFLTLVYAAHSARRASNAPPALAATHAPRVWLCVCVARRPA